VIQLRKGKCCLNDGEYYTDPAWLEVTKWTLVSNSSLTGIEGELTHNFTEAWVYVDDEIIGVFDVPFKIPILKSGNVNIKIYPAIKNNGISATKKIYPFVESFEINDELKINHTLTINPITRYKGSTKFWIGDFEDASTGIVTDPNSLTTMITANDPSILQWGNYGEVNLNTIDSNWIAYTDEHFNLPKGGNEVYLEIDYYNSNSLITGVIGISSNSVNNNQNIQLNAQDIANLKWKKIYIDLKEIVSNSSDAEYFEMSFQALLDEGNSQGKIIIDNIKVVHF